MLRVCGFACGGINLNSLLRHENIPQISPCLSLFHLRAVCLHDQRPATSTTCAKARVTHVTVPEYVLESYVQLVDFVFFSSESKYNYDV